MKATMKDVAELAGVGLGTVSRVVNGYRVKDSTYQKVQEAIARLDYSPDEYARGLKTNRSNIVALIIPTIWHPFFSEFAYHVEKELLKNHYKLFICNADGDAANEIEYIEMLEKNKVDGIIAITYSDIDKYVSSSLPFVSFDRHFSENVSYVTSENFLGGQLAAQELLKRGARQLAYIGGTNIHENETKQRKLGFTAQAEAEACAVLELDMEEPLVNPEEQIESFLRLHPQIDGIFTVNDFMALRVIKVMDRLGKAAPEDYQIIGFDGLRNAEDQSYLLSTIAQSLDLIAQASVDLLLRLISQQQREKTRVAIPVRFEEGGTTKILS
ncbi:LacI family transcriptional regulator [Streptococcus panodentis]|uniref:LacI family transcriptional regulator n=2 Tax=Streptococcus TaxID=1301 RepID=A0ABS5B020_9STRE|nr:LacI family transcriptional regulator [Streptococcus panodentis]